MKLTKIVSFEEVLPGHMPAVASELSTYKPGTLINLIGEFDWCQGPAMILEASICHYWDKGGELAEHFGKYDIEYRVLVRDEQYYFKASEFELL